MKRYFYSVVIFCLSLNVVFSQNDELKQAENFDNSYLKIGLFTNQIYTTASDLQLRFTDSKSSISLDQPLGVSGVNNNIGIDLGLFEREYSNRFIFNPIHLSFAVSSFNLNSLYLETGTGFAYELPLLKRDLRFSENDDDIDEGVVSVLKMRFGLQLDYLFYKNTIIDELGAKGKSIIYVQDKPIGASVHANLYSNMWKFSPLLGVNIRLSDVFDLHIIGMYNGVFSSKENLYFKELNQTSNNNHISTNISPYIYRSSGENLPANLLKLSPLTFKIDLVYLLDN